MFAKYLHQAALVAFFSSAVLGQDSVPSDLSAGFATSGVELQASFTNDAVDGIKDGTTFEKDAVKEEATFALGDSSGISPQRLYTIIMVDTTCDDKRTLHFARANYKFQFDITRIATDSAPLQEYKAPGSFGETGDDRKYSFLMYNNPGGENITTLKLPQEGDKFDVKQFQDDNGLEDAGGGVGIVVKLGGQTNCDGEQASNPSQTSSAAEETTSSAAEAATSSAAGEATSSSEAPASTTAARTTQSTAASRASSGAGSRTTGSSQTPNRSLVEPPEPTNDSSSDIAVASTVLATSIVPDASATGTTTSSGAALQTDSGASELMRGRGQYVVAAGLMALAAL